MKPPARTAKPTTNLSPRRRSAPPGKAGRGAAPAEPAPFAESAGMFLLWLLVLLPPLLILPGAQEAFRLPKLMLSEWLAVGSLVALAMALREVDGVRWRDLWRLPALRAALPLLLLATAGAFVSPHPEHVREALIDLWIGTACLIGWSVALRPERLVRLLTGLLAPATLLALLAILHFHDIFRPLAFLGVSAESRLAVNSTAGNVGDLGTCLVLPALVAQWLLARGAQRADGARRWGLVAVLAATVYALALTQTLTAGAALVAGSLVLWGGLLPRRRAAKLLGAGAAALVLLVLLVAPLRSRFVEKGRQAASGDWNGVLTGRLDGWRAAVWMAGEHPLVGVGQGAYRAEFVPAKLALLDRGVAFFEAQQEVAFVNAHSEPLEVAADLGLPGLLALAWGLWVVIAALRRRRGGDGEGDAGEGAAGRGESALAWGGMAALAVLCLAGFPFRIALVAFPTLLFLAWALRPQPAAAAPAGERSVAGRTLAVPIVVLLALAFVFQSKRLHDRLFADLLLGQVAAVSIRAAAANGGQLPPVAVPQLLAALRRAAAYDPAEVEVPIASGSVLLLGGPDRAVEAATAYRRAEKLEPHWEVYLDLWRAQRASGDQEEARKNLAIAVRLNPRLRETLPPGAL